MRYTKNLYLQVLFGIFVGAILGLFAPDWAVLFKPLSDLFIKLIKMLIAPIIFLTLVSGISNLSDMKEFSKIGGAAMVFFLVTTTFALFLGLVAANFFHPGVGLNITPDMLDLQTAKAYFSDTHISASAEDFLLNIVPDSFLSAFVDGNILQVILVAVMFSAGLIMLGGDAKIKKLQTTINDLAHVFFKLIHMVMYLAPVAAFSAMAFTIGRYGLSPILNMLGLLLLFYVTCIFFVCVVLGTLLRLYCKINIVQLLLYLKTELLIVLGTSSSEPVLPNVMEKLEALGCKKSIVGLVMPVGYSFNLAGTAIYLTLAAIFIAQATNTHLTMNQQLSLLALMIVSSKGSAGVSGSGFIVLASSLAAIGQIPVAGIVLILGIDRFMSDGRALTNTIGNAIATIVIATWSNSFNLKQALRILQDKDAGLVEKSETSIIA